MKLTLLTILIAVFLLSCGSGNNQQSTADYVKVKKDETPQKSSEEQKINEIYEKIEVVFEGKHRREKIEPQLKIAMEKYGNLDYTADNINKCASVLVSLRKSSQKQITEMQILDEMNKADIKNMSFPDQAALIAVILEKQ